MPHKQPTKFPEAFAIVPDIFEDERGFFEETFSKEKYERLGIVEPFVQDNLSLSRKGVLRGLHYDLRMAKLVSCLAGMVFDVIVDLREDSPTYRAWHGIELSAENHLQLYVPHGFAHGFYVLTDSALVHYKQTAHYDPQHERSARWNDPLIAIAWPLDGDPIVSKRDAQA